MTMNISKTAYKSILPPILLSHNNFLRLVRLRVSDWPWIFQISVRTTFLLLYRRGSTRETQFCKVIDFTIRDSLG